MLQIIIKEDLNGNNFLKIKETLKRIGMVGKPNPVKLKYNSKANPRLIQTCGILFKKNNYYLVHFKEMLQMDGNDVDITKDDLERISMIKNLLLNFGLIEGDKEKVTKSLNELNLVVIKAKDKNNYDLVSKYSLGKKKK